MRSKSLYYLVFAGLVLGCLYLVLLSRGWGLSPYHFILDDAYVTFRYAESLTEGLRPVFVEGRDPVEGCSSFLWLLLNAGFVALGWAPQTASNLFSVAGLLVLMGGFAFGGDGETHGHRLLAAAAIGLSPAFILISVQGMETGLAALLTTGSVYAFSRAVEAETTRWFAAFFGLAFLAILTRPDTAPFAIVLSVLLLLRFVSSRPRAILGTALACAVLPGVVYFLWRWSFYGHLLPNTAYIKSGEATISSGAIDKLRSFLITACGPYLVLLGGALAVGKSELEEKRRFTVASVAAAVGIGLGAGLFFAPIQGYLWRFQMPYYPVVLVLFVWVLDEVSWEAIVTTRRRRIGAGAVWLAVLVFPLWTWGGMDKNIAQRWHYDRAQAGKALGTVDGDAGPMLTTEAGAIPYYSDWHAVDLLGLTSEQIAHRGVSRPFLGRLDPTLVVMLDNLDDPRGREEGRRRKICNYLADEDYELRAVIAKTNPRGENRHSDLRAHFYFVDPEAKKAEEIATVLAGMDEVRRVKPSRFQASLEACRLEGVQTKLR